MKGKELQIELRKNRDNLIASITLLLNGFIAIEDTKAFKDFAKYINRYTASELQFLIEHHGYHADIEKIVSKIEKKIEKEKKPE